MYTQHSRITGPPGADGKYRLAAIEDGPTVRLVSQGGDGLVTAVNGDGDVTSQPASEFFATHREALPAEADAFGSAPKHKSRKGEPAET